MYITRPLSLLRKRPDLVSVRPNEGPNSGYLVISDHEVETELCCYGSSEIPEYIKELPFPQNKYPMVQYSEVDYYNVLFIPVLDQPLSSNRYYVISPSAYYKGLAFASSKKGKDVKVNCTGTYNIAVPPRPLNASDIYQQFNIVHNNRGAFTAISVASDGIPWRFLSGYWRFVMHNDCRYQLRDATGLDITLRTRLPEFKFSLSKERSDAVVVGNWYCPFVFVQQGDLRRVRDELLSAFYEVTLEQRWEKIFGRENWGDHGKVVEIDVVVEREEGFVKGRRVVWEERRLENGESWFRGNYLDGDVVKKKKSTWVQKIGGCFCDFSDEVIKRNEELELSGLIMERLKWEQKRGGWVDGVDKKVRIVRREEFGGSNGWTKFGCYVLVESFVFKGILDDSIALVYDFKHTHQIRCKWE